MISPSKVISGAHIGVNNSVRQIMEKVMLAILPATLFGLWLFGWPAINLFVINVGSAVKPFTIFRANAVIVL